MVHNEDMEINDQAGQAAPTAPGHGHAAPAAEEQNIEVAPITPPQGVYHNTEEDIIEIIQSVEPVSALKGLINSIVGNAADIIPRLNGYQITAANCNIIDLDGPNEGKRRCFLQVDVNHPSAAREVSETTVISEDTAPVLNIPTVPAKKQKKGKNKAPVDVLAVRRSDRIAGIKIGFYDAESAAEAKQKEDSSVMHTESEGTSAVNASKGTAIRPNGQIKINLAAHFEAEVINNKAAPPPHLPVETIQAIGTSHCKLPSAMVTKEILEEESSDDSV
jgi:hypothetical protein